MEQGEAWGSLPGGQGNTPPSQPECPPRGHPGTSYSGTGHEYADAPSLPSGCSPRVDMESGPLPTYSHLWSRLASALATPRSGACWPAPWGDPPPHEGGPQCCVCLQKLLGWAQDVSWACKPPDPRCNHVFSSPLLGRQVPASSGPKAAMGPGGAYRRVGSGPPLLCLISLMLIPLSMGPGYPGLPHYFLACLLPPGILATQRVEGTGVTTPACRVSALEGRRAPPNPLLITSPQAWAPQALGSATKHASTLHSCPSPLAWALSWERASLPSHPQCPVGPKWSQAWGIVGPG